MEDNYFRRIEYFPAGTHQSSTELGVLPEDSLGAGCTEISPEKPILLKADFLKAIFTTAASYADALELLECQASSADSMRGYGYTQ